MNLHRCFVAAVVGVIATLSLTLHAEAKQKPYKITYGSSSWNLDSKKVDQAYMFVREKNSGKIAKLLLEETEPDSSIFSGTFSLDWQTATPASMEAYVFPESARYDQKELAKVNATIQSGKVRPSPLVSREENGIKIIDVYDTKDQAKRARELVDLQSKQQKTTGAMPVAKVKKTALGQVDTNLKAEKSEMLNKLADESAKRETMRLRMEQLEAQRLAKMVEDAAALSAAAREKQTQSAREWIQKGDEAYAKADYIDAEAAYAKAFELDPNNKVSYFKYGVSLYRNEKLNEALVALKVSPGNEPEKLYYMGLIHYRLKELDRAREQFSLVKNNPKSNLAASSAFYLGLIEFGRENFDQSKTEFEWVLDNSKDPSLDKKAEEYIDQIANALAVKKEASRKWNVSLGGGILYDSNILLVSDSEPTQGTATEKGGARGVLNGEVDYRFLYKLESELSARVSSTYMYSVDSDFASADPFLITTALPYVRKGTWGKKQAQAIFTPFYEKLYMDSNEDDTRETILNTIGLSGDGIVVNSTDYFSRYSLKLRQEDSLLSSSTGDDDLDATKVTLETQQVFLRGTDKKNTFVALGGFTWNMAKGDNKQFRRIDVGAIFSSPWKKFTKTTWNTGLTAYQLDYYNDTDGRKDTNFTFLLGMSKEVTERWGWSFNTSFVNNDSSLAANEYSKYTAMLLATYNFSR